MPYRIMEDLRDAVPVNIHEDTCPHYTGRDLNATTTAWHHAETLEDAEGLARRLAKSKGCKHCGTCLDNVTLT